MKKLIAMLLVIAMVAALFVGCGPSINVNPVQTNANTPAGTQSGNTPSGNTDVAAGTVLRMATGYNSPKTGLSFDAETAGEGITLADGVTYRAGDLKPTWVEVEKILGIKIEDKYQGNGASAEFDYWKERLGEVDLVSGTASKLSENGEAGSLINLTDYLDQMPNFKAYLDAKSDVGAYYYNILIGGVILYNLFFMLAVFLASEGVKNYKRDYSFLLLALGVGQIIRFFVIPMHAHQETTVVNGAETLVMRDGQFIRVF